MLRIDQVVFTSDELSMKCLFTADSNGDIYTLAKVAEALLAHGVCEYNMPVENYEGEITSLADDFTDHEVNDFYMPHQTKLEYRADEGKRYGFNLESCEDVDLYASNIIYVMKEKYNFSFKHGAHILDFFKSEKFNNYASALGKLRELNRDAYNKLNSTIEDEIPKFLHMACTFGIPLENNSDIISETTNTIKNMLSKSEVK